MPGDGAFWTPSEGTKAQTWQSQTSLPRSYQPFTTRTPWLVTVLIAVLACVATLEVAFHTGIKPENSSAPPSRLLRRQDLEKVPSFTLLTTDATPITQTTAISPTIVTTTPTNAITTIQKETITTTLALTTTTGPTTKTSAAVTPPVGSYADPGDFILLTTAPDAPTTAKGSTTKGSDDFTAFSANPDDFLEITSGSAPKDDFITITTPTPTLEITVISITPEDPSIVPTTIDGTVTSITAAPVVSVITVAIAPTTLTTTDGNGQTTILISTSTFATPPPTTSSPAPTGRQGSISVVKSSQLQIGVKFTDNSYFVSTYAAVIIAVALKLTWALVFSGLKLMEPFYQLSKPNGATAAESLLADYLSAGYSLGHIKYIFSGHWIMLFSTIGYCGMAVLSPLASESMGVIATKFCTNQQGKLSPCSPVWVVNMATARGLEAVLCVVAAMIVGVIICNWPRSSGIFNNPSSIASLASLLSHEDMLQDLRQLDQRASDEFIKIAVSGTRYVMMSYEISPGIYRYGVTKTTSGISTPYSLGNTHNFDYESRNKYAAVSNPTNMAFQDGGPIREQKPFSISGRLVRDSLFLCVLVALFGIVLGYYLEGADTPFNRFFNSGAFGAKFTLTAVAALADFQWKTMEREVRIITPYRHLHKRNAEARKSALVDVGGVSVSSLWGALARGEVFHSVVALTAILSDCLIIAISGVPFSTATVHEAYIISSYVSLAIIAFMILVMIGMLWWRLQVKKLKLPREPDTLLAIWLMLCDEDNELRREFNGWESTSGAHRDRAARGRATRYWGGWAKSSDSKERWSIGVEGQAASRRSYQYAGHY